MSERPTYRTTKKQIAYSTACAWAIILMITAGALFGIREAVDLASIVVPSMVMLIAGLVGIHRVTGSMDYRAAQEAEPEGSTTSPPYDARAQPEGVP
ncbi:NAD(P)+ transhydrogenase beta chain [Shinella sp.]|uniref:NAD(P)+ transhydrogenase beta chain n=1 Tax=Shinella sp. TaxID=1870904 RepID=UPI0039E2EF9F